MNVYAHTNASTNCSTERNVPAFAKSGHVCVISSLSTFTKYLNLKSQCRLILKGRRGAITRYSSPSRARSWKQNSASPKTLLEEQVQAKLHLKGPRMRRWRKSSRENERGDREGAKCKPLSFGTSGFTRWGARPHTNHSSPLASVGGSEPNRELRRSELRPRDVHSFIASGLESHCSYIPEN